MGAISFLLYANDAQIDIEFTKAFNQMKSRGPDDTTYITDSTYSVSKVKSNMDQIRLHLTRQEISEYQQFSVLYGFHRLSINDTSMNASQPFEDPIQHKIVQYPQLRTRVTRRLLCNGEIYNYQNIIDTEGFTDKDLQSSCDVEVILPLYIKHGLQQTLEMIRGDYSFVLTENVNTFDLKTMQVYAVRDVLGSKPLYMVRGKKTLLYMFTSELKGIPRFVLDNNDYDICEVPPGTIWSFQHSKQGGFFKSNIDSEFVSFATLDTFNDIEDCTITSANPDTIAAMYTSIQQKISNAVHEQIQTTDRPYGILLSGGFDSSILTSIVVHTLVTQEHDFTSSPLHVFTMGFTENTDAQYATELVEWLENKYGIDIVHHIVAIDTDYIQQILPVYMQETVCALETYDPTTIRCALPYRILFDYIVNNTNVAVLLDGEGLDELCGYPQLFESTDADFQMSSVSLLTNMHKYDLLRADKLAGHFGLEIRHPFLDIRFVEYILTIHPRLKRPQVYDIDKEPIEKYLIRKAYDVADVASSSDDSSMLLSRVLWRPLQSVVDSFDILLESITSVCDALYSDQDFYDYLNTSHVLHSPTQTRPKNKEEMHYRILFEKQYGTAVQIISKFWTDLIVKN